MSLDFAIEAGYADKPEVPVRLEASVSSIDVIALIDTGASISLFDEGLCSVLDLDSVPDERMTIVGLDGRARRVPRWKLDVIAFPEDLELAASLLVGFLPGLARSTGNLLGRDFLEAVHFGLNHSRRTLYLGAAPSRA